MFFLALTSKSVRRATKLWDISVDGRVWKVQLDVRDLGGHLDFTWRARAGTLSCRVKGAIAGMTGPFSFSSPPLWMPGDFRVFAQFAERCQCADFKGSLQLLTSSHQRVRDKMLLRAILCGGVWNGFLLGQAKKDDVPCQCCGKKKRWSGHLFWECSFPPLLHVREFPEFSSLTALENSKWPRCLLWHGWLLGLSCKGDRAPWAASFGQLACLNHVGCLGAYPVDSSFWTPPEYLDADDIALEMSDNPKIWTDGSREDFSSVGGFEVAGAGAYLPAAEVAFESSV